MKLFFCKIFVFSLLISCLSILSYVFTSVFVKKNYPDAYVAIVKDKIDNIQKSKGNSIILMGGSHTSTSFDSQLIAKSLNKNVINSATVFNTGYLYKLNFLKEYVKKDDVVVFIPEFAYYSDKGRTGADFLFNGFLYDVRLGGLFGIENWKKYLAQFLKIHSNPIKAHFRKPTENKVSKDVFNSYGDSTYHLDKKTKLEDVRGYPVVNSLRLDQKFINELLETKKIIESKGGKFYVTFPAYVKNFVTSNLIQEVNKVKEKYSFFFGNLSEILYDDTAFYDSPYHMLRKERTHRTQNLIDHLKKL